MEEASSKPAFDMSSIAGMITAISTAIGVTFAGLGLSTWRKQLKGTTEYELARKLLLQVYRVRESIYYVRQPFMRGAEAGDNVPEGVAWEVVAYQNRWKEVRDAMLELDAMILECEVIWGNNINKIKRVLNMHVMELNGAVGMFMLSKNDKAFSSDFTKAQRDILCSRGEEDPYNTRLGEIVSDFEEYVKPHLNRLEASKNIEKSN